MRSMKVVTLLLAIALSAGSALAQGKGGHGGEDKGGGRPPQMTQQDRERMRNDMRDASRDRGRDRERPERQRPMTREERAKLRQDIQDANKDLRR